jgi:hypothetical protein
MMNAPLIVVFRFQIFRKYKNYRTVMLSLQLSIGLNEAGNNQKKTGSTILVSANKCEPACPPRTCIIHYIWVREDRPARTWELELICANLIA